MKMNKVAIKNHLSEAAEQLAAMITNVDKKDFDEETFRVEISHLYHHVNSAWNGRHCSREEYRDCSTENFSRWRKFPKEEEMYLENLGNSEEKA